jgi:hypothetical protein
VQIVATIPTMPSRVGVLETAIKSIVKQVDAVFVYLNGFSEIPAFLMEIPGVHARIPEKDHGSTSRFLVSHETLSAETLILSCDDDLEYPPNYAATLYGAFKRYGGVITCHGRLLMRGRPLSGWFRGFWQAVYPCLERQDRDSVVDICGTGAMLYRQGDIRPLPEHFQAPNYDDVEFSIISRQLGLKITCVAHADGWIRYLYPPGPSIWEMTAKTHHTQLIELVNRARLWADPIS